MSGAVGHGFEHGAFEFVFFGEFFELLFDDGESVGSGSGMRSVCDGVGGDVLDMFFGGDMSFIGMFVVGTVVAGFADVVACGDRGRRFSALIDGGGEVESVVEFVDVGVSGDVGEIGAETEDGVGGLKSFEMEVAEEGDGGRVATFEEFEVDGIFELDDGGDGIRGRNGTDEISATIDGGHVFT